MYSTKTAITMSLRDLLEKVSDYDIYSYYLGPIKPKKLINSPLRPDDKIPSFAIFPTNEGTLLFKDHGTGVAGNALKFLKLYKGIDTREELEHELLKIVKWVNPSQTTRKAVRTDENSPSELNFGIVRQPFTEVDKQYWKQFHISMNTLKKFDVFSIKYFLRIIINCHNMQMEGKNISGFSSLFMSPPLPPPPLQPLNKNNHEDSLFRNCNRSLFRCPYRRRKVAAPARRRFARSPLAQPDRIYRRTANRA